MPRKQLIGRWLETICFKWPCHMLFWISLSFLELSTWLRLALDHLKIYGQNCFLFFNYIKIFKSNIFFNNTFLSYNNLTKIILSWYAKVCKYLILKIIKYVIRSVWNTKILQIQLLMLWPTSYNLYYYLLILIYPVWCTIHLRCGCSTSNCAEIYILIPKCSDVLQSCVRVHTTYVFSNSIEKYMGFHILVMFPSSLKKRITFYTMRFCLEKFFFHLCYLFVFE